MRAQAFSEPSQWKTLFVQMTALYGTTALRIYQVATIYTNMRMISFLRCQDPLQILGEQVCNLGTMVSVSAVLINHHQIPTDHVSDSEIMLSSCSWIAHYPHIQI